MSLLQGWISWVALTVSALTFFYSRHEARRRKKWLIHRLIQFRSDIQGYRTEIDEAAKKTDTYFPLGLIAHVPLWTEMQLDTVDVSLLAELDNRVEIAKGEASLGFIKYQLERWYSQPLHSVEEQPHACFIIGERSEVPFNLKKLDDLLEMIDKALGKLDRWYRKLW
jgi:hypothetical protein